MCFKYFFLTLIRSTLSQHCLAVILYVQIRYCIHTFYTVFILEKCADAIRINGVLPAPAAAAVGWRIWIPFIRTRPQVSDEIWVTLDLRGDHYGEVGNWIVHGKVEWM